MAIGPICIYADASVFGGAFDEEFEVPSRAFFSQVREGRFGLVVSPVVADEIEEAPRHVREFFEAIFPLAQSVANVAEAVRLQQAYLNAGIVGPARLTDALHVALATVSGCRAIVSWNFRHIVHLKKIPLYGGVSMTEGYPPIGIHTPQEVIGYEDEDV